MTWVLILWCALILIWAIAGGNNAQNHCNAHTQLQQDACAAGTGIGVAIVLLIGFFGFVFFGLIWFMTRPKGRNCPVCGEPVKRGRTTCAKCGYDFSVGAVAAGAAGEAHAAPASSQIQAPAQVQVPAGWFPDP